MEKFLVVLGVIALVVLVSFFSGILVFWLWNALLPVLFGFPVITFWQAIGLTLLCNLLFKSTSTKSST